MSCKSPQYETELASMAERSLASERSGAGGASRITASQLNSHPAQSLRAVQRGLARMQDIPWVLQCNHGVGDEMASAKANGERFDRKDKISVDKYRKLIMLASEQNNQKAKAELASYRKFEITSDVMAAPWAMSAFQVVPLRMDELPLIERPQSRNLNSFTVTSCSIDGSVERMQWESTKAVETLEMGYISTPRVEYKLVDLQRGDVSQVDAVNWRLVYDLEMKMDTLARANIDSIAVASGLRATMSLHPLVIAANIPDKNYLDLSGYASPSAAGVLDILKLKAILLHINQFGSAGGADVPIQIANINVSPQNVRDPWDFIDLVSGWNGGAVQPVNTVPKGVREQIFNTGMMTQAWGNSFSWTPNAQLDKGEMYITTTEPLGWVFTKPEFDRMLVWDESNSPDHAERRMGEVMYQKTVKFVMPDEWRYRVVKVKL